MSYSHWIERNYKPLRIVVTTRNLLQFRKNFRGSVNFSVVSKNGKGYKAERLRKLIFQDVGPTRHVILDDDFIDYLTLRHIFISSRHYNDLYRSPMLTTIKRFLSHNPRL